MKKIKGRWLVHGILALALLLGCLGGQTETVQAGAWSSPKAFYDTYGNDVVFCPISMTDGVIYYATKAAVASTSTTYRTLGWKVTVQNLSGSTLQTMYFKLGGSYMYHAGSQVSGKYEYNMYCLSLYQLKCRMNAKAEKALNKGKANVKMDACMTVVKSGKVKGRMDDNGPVSGSVYTTYGGIAGAANWKSSSRQSLYSYFDKYVLGLFYQVDVIAGEGIKTVTGTGRYCYGTFIEVSATPQDGYVFADWNGLLQSSQEYDGFFVNGQGICIAQGMPKLLRIYYHRNLNAQDSVMDCQIVRYEQSGATFEAGGWQKDGKQPLGWAFSPNETKARYKLYSHITAKWINKYAPEVHLYAIWEDAKPDPDPNPPTPTPTPPTPTPPVPDPTPPTPIPPTPEPDDTQKPASNKIVRCRFISSKYFEDEQQNLIPQERGGLASDSVWATDSVRRQILRFALQQK